jgi:hypothetical protein
MNANMYRVCGTLILSYMVPVYTVYLLVYPLKYQVPYAHSKYTVRNVQSHVRLYWARK